MLGRQFFYPDAAALQRMFGSRTAPITRRDGWAEPFFQALGARTVDSVDASAFEGATLVHDLNQPIPAEWRDRYTVVFDGGTLEHVFNAPQAFKNCMDLLEVGGTFVQATPANNYMGHGFYQFSPELMFQLFRPGNGFELVTVVLREDVNGGRSFVVTAPSVVKRRIQMTNPYPTMLYTIARKVANVEHIGTPQQEDYAQAWRRRRSDPAYVAAPGSSGSAVRSLVRNNLPPAFERFLRGHYVRGPEAQPDCYRRISEHEIVAGRF
jgi:hypothetical protein